MTTKKRTSTSANRKQSVRSASASTAKRANTAKKTAKPRPKAVKSDSPSNIKVDYYPNRMTVLVSVLSGTALVAITIIAVLNS